MCKEKELKPCPFCGCNIIKRKAEHTLLGNIYWSLLCKDCHCGTPGYIKFDDAVKAWNRRVNDEID